MNYFFYFASMVLLSGAFLSPDNSTIYHILINIAFIGMACVTFTAATLLTQLKRERSKDEQ